MISETSYISIGLGIFLIIGTFYLGSSYANISTRLNQVEKSIDYIIKTLDKLIK